MSSSLSGFDHSDIDSWFSLGGLMASVTLQIRNKAEPMNWTTPLYIQYGMIGLSFIIFVLLPESPCKRASHIALGLCLRCLGWLVSKGKNVEARKVLNFKYGNIEGYDIDGELVSTGRGAKAGAICIPDCQG
jgi:hypothetical protein